MEEPDGAAEGTKDPVATPPPNGDGAPPEPPEPEIKVGATIPEITDAGTAVVAQRDGLPPEDVEPSGEQANAALASMLGTAPPPLPQEVIQMKGLAERLGVDSFEVRMRGLTERELESLSEHATKPPTKQQKRMGMKRGEPDPARLKRLIVVAAMLEPNLRDTQLLDRDGPLAENVVQAWFLPGEVDQLSEAVNDMSGYGMGAVERAKE